MLTIIFTLLNFNFIKSNIKSPQYNIKPKNAKQVGLFSAASYFLMLMRLIPLDLIINTELGKIVVSKLIESDHEMTKIDDQTGDLITCKV